MAVGILAGGLLGCVNESEEREWIDAAEAREGSIATMQLIRDLVPDDVVDTTRPLPELADHDAAPRVCQGIETGNAGAALYYPGETLVPLADGTDAAEALITVMCCMSSTVGGSQRICRSPKTRPAPSRVW